MSPVSSDEAYRQAGVDLSRANAVVDIAKRAARRTRTPHVLGGIGGFSGAFEIPSAYRQPVMLSACDGVGTKLKVAFMADRHDTVGVDLVAMSVNDLLVNGGEPLAFLDYIASESIESERLAQLLDGIATGCEQAGCALLGGETAEMPGFYPNNEYELAGFCVGVAEKGNLYPRLDQIQAGDVLIGLPSSGLHSNGYSLVRKILFQDSGLSLDDTPALLQGQTIGEALLTPTRIYVKPVLALLKALPTAVNAMVHITGGGFYDNIPRILPEGFSARLDSQDWQLPPVFQLLKTLGGLSNEAMWHTFNCGIGYVLLVKPEQAEAVTSWLQRNTDWPPVRIGEIIPGAQEVLIQ